MEGIVGISLLYELGYGYLTYMMCNCMGSIWVGGITSIINSFISCRTIYLMRLYKPIKSKLNDRM